MGNRSSDPNVEYYNKTDVGDHFRTSPGRLRDIEAVLIVDAITRSGKSASELTLLDLGCGGGRTSLPLAALGLNVVALDLSHMLTRLVLDKQPDMSVICADAVQLPLANSTFDIVLFSANGLDLVVPAELRFDALREVVRVLRPKGYFIYSSHALPLIPYNWRTFGVAFYNLMRGRLPVKASYFEESRPKQRAKLVWYATGMPAIRQELESCKMRLLRHSKINFIESGPRTAALAFLSWGRYMLAEVIEE